MSVLDLTTAKAHLNIQTSAGDAEIQGMIDGAEAILANIVGPLSTLPERTDRVRGGATLVLPLAPVVSVTSIAGTDGSTVLLTDVTKNLAAGVIYYTNSRTGFWCASYDVTYVPGRTSVPGDIMLAIKEMVRHLWTTQQGSGVRPGSTPSAESTSYLVPYRVQELLEPYRLITIGAA